MVRQLWMIPVMCMTMAAGDPVPPLAGIPNVTIIPYDVGGGNPASVRRSIDAMRPKDPNDGKAVDGLSSWHFSYSWKCDEKGKATIRPDDLVFSAEVKIPHLTNTGTSLKFREKFDIYIQSLLEHEDGHVRFAWERRGDIIAAINSSTCVSAKLAAQTILQSIGLHDVEYDKVTDHGRTTMKPFS